MRRSLILLCRGRLGPANCLPKTCPIAAREQRAGIANVLQRVSAVQLRRVPTKSALVGGLKQAASDLEPDFDNRAGSFRFRS